MTELNFFCTTTKNADNTDNPPKHESCGGKTVIDFGRSTEAIVPCECECHKGKEGLKVLQ